MNNLHVGTKNVAKEIKKITMGPNKSDGIKWWRELAYKRWCTNNVMYMYVCNNKINVNAGRSTKTHLYWSMRNCNGLPEDLLQKVLNISKHYQV